VRQEWLILSAKPGLLWYRPGQMTVVQDANSRGQPTQLVVVSCEEFCCG